MCIFSGISLLYLLSYFVYGMLSNKLRQKYSCSQIWRKCSFITGTEHSRSLSSSLPRTHTYSKNTHTCVCMFVWISLWGKKTAKQPQKQNCKQTNCKSFSIFILILSTISSKKHLANLWGGAQDVAASRRRWQTKGTAMRYKDIYFAYTGLGKTRIAGKTAHFPKVVKYMYILTISSNSIWDGVCVCVALRDM